MKLFASTAFFLLLLTGCSDKKNIDLYYDGIFKLSFAHDFLSGATIFSASQGGLSIKTDSGAMVLGQIISSILDDFPGEFDFRKYPKYALKIEPLTNLNNDLAERFEGISYALNHSYDLKNSEMWETEGTTTYSLCSNTECVAYIVKNTIGDRIFSIYTTDIGKTMFKRILRQNLYVE